ncbi:hypothetical protein ACWCPQ_22710 [Nocardia sp. NPDC001965]
MMRLDELARITGQRLRAIGTGAADGLYRRLSGTAHDIRAIVDNFVTIDSKTPAVPGRVDAESPYFTGQSPRSGRLHRFTSNQIRSVPVLDPDKNIVGVRFPSKIADSKENLSFTREGYKKISTGYAEGTRRSGSTPLRRLLERILPLPAKPKWAYGKSWPAPWPDENLIFTRAHANPDSYQIQVKKKLIGNLSRWTRMSVDGKTYGRILTSNEHFSAAHTRIITQAAGRPVVANVIQMSCAPARGPAADQSFQSLNSAGTGVFDVFAPKGTHITFWPEGSPGLVRQEGSVMIEHAVVIKPGVVGTPKPWAEYRTQGEHSGGPG